MIKFTRCAKIWGIQYSTEFLSAYNIWRTTANNLSKWFRQNITNGKLEVNRFDITFNNQKYSFASFKDLPEIKVFFVDWHTKTKSLQREVIMYIAERFRGYSIRNQNRKIPTIHIKENKSYYFKDNDVRVNNEDNSITFKTPLGHISLKYKYGLKIGHVNQKWVGGNLSIKQKAFIAAVECSSSCLYKHKDILAFDLNMQKKNWLTFSDESFISMSDDLKSACDEVHDIQKLLREKEKPVTQRQIRSKERSKLRKQWKLKHKAVKRKIIQIADQILNKVIDNELLLAIDAVTTGQTHGTWGQDHLIPYLISQCENRGIPFYVVNPAFTSQICHKCNYQDKKNRKNTETFECIKCTYSGCAHDNAAMNIRNKAQNYFDTNFPFGNYGDFRKENKIRKQILLST